jgi:hypothetical protein
LRSQNEKVKVLDQYSWSQKKSFGTFFEKVLHNMGTMKKLFLIMTILIFISSCEIENRGGHKYPHALGWEHRHHHSDDQNHGFDPSK